MADIQVEQVFDIPANQLWELIGDFGDMSKWTGLPPETCIQEGEGIGSLRTLRFREGEIIIDRLEAETDTSYTYSIVNNDESPLPYKSYRATMSVEPVDATSSRFVWAGEFEPDGITDDEAVVFAQNMYSMGIGYMKKAVAGL
jgi:hypothetical protein